MKYLHPKQYYIDLYDKHTVDECRWWEKNDKPLTVKNPTKKSIKKDFQVQVVFPIVTHFIKGERYAEKESTIREWMMRDQARDDKVEEAQAPENIHCLKCKALMTPTHKDLWSSINDENERVLFMYDCPNECLPRRSFYEDGEEWKVKPQLCPTCKIELVRKHKKMKTKVVTIEKCTSCTYTNTDEMSFAEKKEKPDTHLKKDCARFCLSEEDGQKYLSEKIKLEELKSLVDKFQEKEDNKDLYDKVAKLKKLKIIELEKHIIPSFKKSSYIQFRLGKPDVGKEVIVEFTVHDSNNDRDDRASCYDLKKILKKALNNTNWRLMSNDVSYRLGMLSGRLRAYEREEDLVKLVK